MQPTVARLDRPITVAKGVSATELFARCGFRYRPPSLENFEVRSGQLTQFTPWLINLSTRKSREERRAILQGIEPERKLKLADSLHLAAFGFVYPEYPGGAHPNPVMAIGNPIEVGDYKRTLAIFGSPHEGRDLYTFFDCAHFGPLVSYLMIEEMAEE
ncbi:MAG TPA: hypothetical protein VFY28_02750 [Candidatus Paceibacterota bacterium]|nr:hypothetical protein [Candidatus Paceibacterota bacterium]